MAKESLNDYSTTPGNNTDIDGLNIAENCSPANINNALRSLMSHLADIVTGAVRVTNWYTTSLNVSGTATIGTLSLTTVSATTGTFSGNGTFGGTLGVTGAITGSSTIAGTAITGERFIATGTTIPANGMYLPGTNTLGFATNSTVRFRIAAAGDFQIGTSSGTSGQVFTSGGAGAPPTWTTPATAYDPAGAAARPFNVSLPINSAANTVRIEAGIATTGGGGSATVTFTNSYTTTPVITTTVMLASNNDRFANVTALTTTGCTVWAYDASAGAQSGIEVHWIAVGPTA